VTDVVVDTAELYRRYKSLTIAVSAALILGERLDDIAVAVDDLGREAAGTPCSEPALTLRRLVERGLAGESTDAEVEQVRSSHRGLRREVWTTHPCEYVPCCAVGAHEHR
jgi:hypothetical protein